MEAYERTLERLSVLVLEDIYSRLNAKAVEPKLGNLEDIAAKYFRGNTTRARAFINDDAHPIPPYLGKDGNKMYLYDEVWEAIAKTKWESA